MWDAISIRRPVKEEQVSVHASSPERSWLEIVRSWSYGTWALMVLSLGFSVFFLFYGGAFLSLILERMGQEIPDESPMKPMFEALWPISRVVLPVLPLSLLLIWLFSPGKSVETEPE
jgi:hypothetical protein